ncbi:MAG TPA: hypothetical protein VLM44_03540 [Lutibacter sp.]|nr:hypothetical protein [Lutibacter sp.]
MDLKDQHIIKTANLNIGYTSKKKVNTIAENLTIELAKENWSVC